MGESRQVLAALQEARLKAKEFEAQTLQDAFNKLSELKGFGDEYADMEELVYKAFQRAMSDAEIIRQIIKKSQNADN